MIYKQRRPRLGHPGGFFHLQDSGRRSMHGYGEAEYIRLRDEFGHIWRGWAERQSDKTVRYTFVDTAGKHITGVSDSYGIVLRDERGKTWRGIVD